MALFTWNPVEVLGFLAGMLGISLALPQTRKIYRLKNRDGVSTWTWFLMFASCSAWMGYGIRTDSISQTVTNFLAVILNTWLLSILLDGRWWRWWLLSASFLALVSVALLAPLGASFALLVAFSLVRWPQAFRAIRGWLSGAALPAVSYLTWVLGSVSSSLWCIYGALTDRPIIIVSALLSLAASLTIIVGTFFASRRASQRV